MNSLAETPFFADKKATFKKAIVSLFMALGTTVLVSGVFTLTTIGVFLLYYALANVWQNEAIKDNKPQYKIVINNAVWLAGIAAFFTVPLLFISPDAVSLLYDIDVRSFSVGRIVSFCLWCYGILYLEIAVTGILTIFLLTRSSNS